MFKYKKVHQYKKCHHTWMLKNEWRIDIVVWWRGPMHTFLVQRGPHSGMFTMYQEDSGVVERTNAEMFKYKKGIIFEGWNWIKNILVWCRGPTHKFMFNYKKVITLELHLNYTWTKEIMVWWQGPTHKCLSMWLWEPTYKCLSTKRSPHLNVETEPRI